MSDQAEKDILESLESLLALEERALLEGQLEEILRLAQEKEALIEKLDTLKAHDGAQMEMLRNRVMRNQSLLDGTLQGIRQVAARVATIRQLRKTLETYDDKGRKQTIDGEVNRRMERRA